MTARRARKPAPAPALLPCRACGARCCRYVAVEIDRPRSKKDYDHIRWYLLHAGVSVFIDHDGSWHIEYRSDCSALTETGQCAHYARRPHICRRHGDGDPCEYGRQPYRRQFHTARAFEAYLDRRGVDWRWKRKG